MKTESYCGCAGSLRQKWESCTRIPRLTSLPARKSGKSAGRAEPLFLSCIGLRSVQLGLTSHLFFIAPFSPFASVFAASVDGAENKRTKTAQLSTGMDDVFNHTLAEPKVNMEVCCSDKPAHKITADMGLCRGAFGRWRVAVDARCLHNFVAVVIPNLDYASRGKRRNNAHGH
jgi:hypothetical protein